MCTQTQDRQCTPVRSASKTSLAKVPATCVQDVCIWVHSRCYGLRNAADYRKANGWICTACMTQPHPRAPTPPPSPAHHVRQDVQHTTVERQWYRQQTDRVLGEPSDICTDCGASPQEVRHLFACNAHPTDLSPEDLWRNPVGSIRAFSYLDNGNLDWLEDGPGRGKQQQQHNMDKHDNRTINKSK